MIRPILATVTLSAWLVSGAALADDATTPQTPEPAVVPTATAAPDPQAPVAADAGQPAPAAPAAPVAPAATTAPAAPAAPVATALDAAATVVSTDLLNLGHPFDADAFAKAIQGRIWGIDLSHHNKLAPDAADHIDDWGISFAILKTTEGIDYKDPQYDAHHAVLAGRDIALGSYHFYRVGDDPVEQADWFLKNIKPGTALVVDVERAGQVLGPDLPDKVDQFVRRVQEKTGQGVVIYSGANLYSQHLSGLSADHYVWVADYGVAPAIAEWSLWQFYDHVMLPGIENRVDANVFNGDDDAFKAFVAALGPAKKG